MPGPAINGAGSDGRQVVEVGDQIRRVGAGPRSKRVPDEQRNTTPYMTKYERARVLGTRALQIRYDSGIWARRLVQAGTWRLIKGSIA